MAWTRNRPVGLVYNDVSKASGGYTLYSSNRATHADLIDPCGRIVHQWSHPDGIVHLKLLPSGNLLFHTRATEAEGAENIGGSASALVEVDADSRVVWRHEDAYMHHDYQRLPNGNTLVVRWDKIPRDIAARVQGGHIAKDDPDWMWGDVIREIDPSGATVSEWKSWDHLSTDHHVKCPLESRKEWTHLNSIEFTPEGRWLLSFRLTSTIVQVDPGTGSVRWRYNADQGSHQHHATWLENGNILYFENGCHRLNGPAFSQIQEIVPDSKQIAWTYKATPILAFNSFMVSGCERLPNGNTFITEGATGRLFEVTPEGETVWEFVSPWLLESKFGPTAAVFRAYRIAEDDPRLSGLELSPGRYATTNERVEAGETLGADAEPPVDDKGA